MKRTVLLVICVVMTLCLSAQHWSGVYSFNKGINKQQGCIYVNHFKPDSVFMYLTYMSGAPDFNTFNWKGFIGIHDGAGDYRSGDSIHIQFSFVAGCLSLTGDTSLSRSMEKGIWTKYKKTSASLKKNSTIYIDFVEQQAKVKKDSVWAFEVPTMDSKPIELLTRNEDIKVIDSYGYFYLIETPENNKEFLWVPKKNLSVLKN